VINTASSLAAARRKPSAAYRTEGATPIKSGGN
jgi:hypothetical protein